MSIKRLNKIERMSLAVEMHSFGVLINAFADKSIKRDYISYESWNEGDLREFDRP